MAERKASAQPPLVTIYTDGACEPNPGPGGWGAVLEYAGHVRELSGADPDTTNNRMELRAAIEALRALNRPSRVDLHTDSEYLQRGMTEWMAGWLKRQGKKQPRNWDLWEELLEATQPHEVHWHWVQSHAGDRLNERAHRLANSMIAQARREVE